MNESANKVMIGMLSAADADRLQTRLARDGITVLLAVNHATCTSGCSPSKEIWAHPDDVNAIVGMIATDRAAELKKLGVDPATIDQVFDPERPTAICPACGTEFSTTANACPDCGLAFDAP